MARFRYKHIQSTVENKVPSDLLDGEIAVNRFAGKEKLFLKNASDNIVSFSTDSQIDGKLADKLNVSDFNTYSGAVDTTINSKASQSDLNTLSGTVTAHTASTSIHLTTTEKTNIDSLATNIAAISGITSTKVGNWDTSYGKVSGVTASTEAINSLTGTVGTMAFKNANSYSSATEVNTALSGKSNTGHTHVASDVTDLGTAAKKGVSNGISNTDNLIEAKHIYSGVGVTIAYDSGNKRIQLKSTSGNVLSDFDASDFLVDGMVDSVTLESKSGTTYLVITWNTAAGKTKTELNIGDIFEADNYYTKNDLTATTGYATVTKANSANTASTVALTGVTGADDLKAIEAITGTSGILKKTAANTWSLDTTSYSSATQVNTALSGKSDTGHTHDDRYYTESELTGSTTTVVVAKAASATTAASATVADSANSVALSNVSGADDLKAIEALTGTSGLLKKTAANTWTLDTTDYSNKNAFGKIKINAESTTIDSDTTNDTLTISGGSFVTLTSDATNDKFTIGVSTGTSSSDLARGDHNHDGAYQAKGSYLTGTTTYAGSSTQGGAATSANKLNTDAGSATNPIYFSGGVPTALSYTIEKSVPSNAVFTDTKVTAVGNHYTPSATSADTKSATASSTAELAWGSAVVTGVTLSGDAKGHITSVTLASGKLKTPVTGVTLASGTNNGTVKLTVNGTATDNIAVKGLSGMAYQATSSYSSATQVNTALSGKQDTLTFDGTYNASTNKAATVSTVTNAIGALDASLTGSAGAGKTLTAFSQTDGKVTATFGNISITKSQVSDFPTSMTPTAHDQASNTITAMTGYAIASASGAVATNDTLNNAVGKLEKRIALLEAALGGMTLVKLTSAQYEALTIKDPNTMYVIND